MAQGLTYVEPNKGTEAGDQKGEVVHFLLWKSPVLAKSASNMLEG